MISPSQHKPHNAPLTSVRGRIRAWIDAHADKLGDDVLEVGSRLHAPDAWWANNRDLALGKWTGVDMQPGDGVDLVCDVCDLPADMNGRFSAVLCSEALEHVARPWVALRALRDVLQPDGWIIVTTLTSFPLHAFPDDFWRFTESGLRLLLTDAGFRNVTTAGGGRVDYLLNDHGEDGMTTMSCPMHVFGTAQC